MGEAKNREEAAKAAAAADAEEQRKLQELLNAPITEEDAKKALADADVNQAQILVARQKWVAKQDAYRQAIAEAQRGIDECDEAIASIVLTRNVIFRRSLNRAAKEPVMGEPVKTN